VLVKKTGKVQEALAKTKTTHEKMGLWVRGPIPHRWVRLAPLNTNNTGPSAGQPPTAMLPRTTFDYCPGLWKKKNTCCEEKEKNKKKKEGFKEREAKGG